MYVLKQHILLHFVEGWASDHIHVYVLKKVSFQKQHCGGASG